MHINDENPNYLFELLDEISDLKERARTRREWGLVDSDEAESPQDQDKYELSSSVGGKWK